MSVLFGPANINLKELFGSIETIAVIGASSNPYRTSNHITKYLVDQGFEVIPVNPNESNVLGLKSYPSIFDIPQDKSVDVMNVFRNKMYTDKVVDDILTWSNDRNQKPVIWTQLDVSTESAKKRAEESGLTYIKNRCIMVDHRSI
ncbi:CoA-binding protein [Rhodohalobacter halophilus]|uniref:CoA-binding protein n=1 Tax=Rhodohalobacter halophilus TaxID=1812810 RepID=UPI00083FC302|nr:CoA-binding protein [Rhodohalobacter halophilus]